MAIEKIRKFCTSEILFDASERNFATEDIFILTSFVVFYFLCTSVNHPLKISNKAKIKIFKKKDNKWFYTKIPQQNENFMSKQKSIFTLPFGVEEVGMSLLPKAIFRFSYFAQIFFDEKVRCKPSYQTPRALQLTLPYEVKILQMTESWEKSFTATIANMVTKGIT